MRKLMVLPAIAAMAIAGSVAMASGASAAQSVAANNAIVSVVHGIPDTPVNVFVNGKDTLPDFKPGTVAGPLELPAGDYEVKIYPASNTAGTGTPVLQATATVKAGQNVTLVAHLSASGAPALTPFVNDTSAIKAGMSRLVVRHVAAAPAVDVRANGKVAFAKLTNPNQAMADLPAGTVSADVVLAGTDTVAIGPADVTLTAGTETIVYAIGSAESKNLSLVVQKIDGLGAAPGGMPAGTGGLADPQTSGLPMLAWAAIIAGALLMLGGAAVGTMRVRRQQ